MEYKHIKFVLARSSVVSSTWYCLTKDGDDLGEVFWYPSWKQYCFYPDEGTVFSADYLADIQDFIGRAKSLHTLKGADDERNQD